MVQNAIMVSNHAPILPSSSVIEAAWRLAQLAHKSGLSKAHTEADAFFVILYGYELGVSPMTSLRSIYSVVGAPSCSGELMLALIRNSGKAQIIKLPDSHEITDSATVYMKRQDTGEEYRATFTLQQATQAGLVKDGGNWKKYPKAMLLWRAVSICAKALFSDVIAGLYTLEEIAPNTPVDETGTPTGAIIEGEAVEVKAAPQLPAATLSLEPPATAPTPPTPSADAPPNTRAVEDHATQNGAKNGNSGLLDATALMKTAFEQYRLGSVQVLAKLGVNDLRDFTGTLDTALALLADKPAPEDGAQNGNGEKAKHDLGAVHGLVAFLYENDFARTGSLNKLVEGRNTEDPDNAIKPEDTTLGAAAKVFYHRAFADHKFDRAKVLDILNGGLTDTKVANFGDWYKLCGADMGAALKSAWKAVQEYVELSKLPPAKPAGKSKKAPPVADPKSDDLDTALALPPVDDPFASDEDIAQTHPFAEGS